MNLNTVGDIDYSFLTSRQKKHSVKKILTEEERVIEQAISEGVLNDESVKEFRRIISLQNRTLDWKSIYSVSITGTPKCNLQPFIENGLLKNEGYEIVAFDLASILLNIITQTANVTFDISKYDLSGIGVELTKFFSLSLENDSDYQNILYTLYAINCPPLTAYLDKCLELSKGTQFISTDLVGARRVYGKLSPIESITLPIIHNLNSIVYIFSTVFKEQFKRGEKRFLSVSNHTLYYYVREDKLSHVLNMKFELNGQKTCLKARHIKGLGAIVHDICR